MSCQPIVQTTPAPLCNGSVVGTQVDNPLSRNPYPALCSIGTAAD